MTTELALLLWSLPLYGLYLGAQSLIYRYEHGLMFAQTARDVEPPPSAVLGRAERALRNFQETWPVFIVLTLVAHLATSGDPWVFWGAIVWLVGRVIYLPLYLAGTYGIRSLVWCGATLGLGLMFGGVLF